MVKNFDQWMDLSDILMMLDNGLKIYLGDEDLEISW